MQRLGLALGLLLASCQRGALEQHIRTAADLRATNEAAIEEMRATCASDNTSEACVALRVAQHAFVDTHNAYVQVLVREAEADHWRRPRDARALDALCDDVTAYREAARAVGIDLLFTRRVARACGLAGEP